jgi:hypothetical protein
MRRAGTSASIRTAKVVIASVLFAITLLAGGKTTPAEALKTFSSQLKVGKTDASVPSMTIRHYTFTGYSPVATQDNFRFFQNYVQKTNTLSNAAFACTSVPNRKCVLIRVDTTHDEYSMLKENTASRAFIYLNAHDWMLSLTQLLLRSSLPESLKKFIYNQTQKGLTSLYQAAEKEMKIVKKLKESAPVKNKFLVDIYDFHTKNPLNPVKKPLPSYSNHI